MDTSGKLPPQTTERVETRCGVGGCRPKWLQTFNNPKFLCVSLSFFSFIQGFSVNGINNVNTVAYERRFQLTSVFIGWITSIFSVSAAIGGIVISFYGNRRNKAKFLAVAIFISALGCMCMFLPHFITDQYEWGQDFPKICWLKGSPDTCVPGQATGDVNQFVYLLLVGQALQGIGTSAYLSVGLGLIDDSVKSVNAPLYIAAVQICYVLGPLCGFLAGGAILNVFVDFDSVDTTQLTLTPRDPRWVGAWWLGFVIAFVLMMLSVIPFLMFGEEIPTAKHVRETRESQTHADNSKPNVSRDSDKPMSIKEFHKVVYSLIRNAPFMCLILAYTFQGMAFTSGSTFAVKIIVLMFGISTSRASFLIGAVNIPAVLISQLGSAFFMRRLKLKVQGTLKLLIVLSAITILTEPRNYINCGQQDLVGYNAHYPNRTEPIPNLSSPCNEACDCQSEPYQPSCDVTGNKFYSPCMAGCQGFSQMTPGVFHNCSCASFGESSNNSVSFAQCPEVNCRMFIPYLIVVFIYILTISGMVVPVTNTLLRCTKENEKTFALGVTSFVSRIIGVIPGPIIMGAIIDSTCVIWGEKCGERTSCWVYDINSLARNTTAFNFCTGVPCFLLIVLTYKLYKPPACKADLYNADSNVCEKTDEEENDVRL